MAKRMEDMTKEEIRAEFEDEPVYRMTRRRKNLVLLTLRVPPEVKKRLAEKAKQRGVPGYTAMARDLIERGLRTEGKTGDAMVQKIAKATANEVVERLRRRKAG